MFSLRRHLMLWLSGALALGACGLALMTYAFALDELNEVFDEQLRQVAFAVLEHALPEPRSPASRPAPEDLVGFDLVTQVWSLQGERIFLSDPQVAIPFSSVEGFQTVRLSTGDWRVYTDRSARHLIQAAQAVRIRERFATDVALKILVPSLIASPALAALLAVALRRGLAPLTGTVADIQQRSSTSLEPIDIKRLPAELVPLLGSVNALLERLSAAMAAQRRLIADAAHGLRTPLTALRLQVQAWGAADAAARADATTDALVVLDRATHTVGQLLALSRAEPDVAINREPVDLAALARATVADFHRLADTRGVDIGAEIEPAHGPAFTVEGIREQLQAMLSNLVDNAIRYTPAGGRVDVRVRHGVTPDQVQVIVMDTGPGIPPAERLRVFERFYRCRQEGGGPHAEGSGLGLAIVKAAADRHDATVELNDGMGSDPGSPGLSVQIAFYRALSSAA